MDIDPDDLRAAKAALRREAFARRDALPADHRAAAAERLAAIDLAPLGAVAGAVVSGFQPIRSEIDPRPLMLRLEAAGARLCLPIVDHPRIRFLAWRFGEPLQPAGFGTLGPCADAPEVDPDLVLAPLAAFDRAGRRLGYGAGHYDRALARLRAMKPIRAVGVAFSAQEVARVPADDSDARLDGVITEDGYRPASPDRS